MCKLCSSKERTRVDRIEACCKTALSILDGKRTLSPETPALEMQKHGRSQGAVSICNRATVQN